MFSQKKSCPPQTLGRKKSKVELQPESNSFIKFFITEDDDLKVEFGFENISEMIILSDTVQNGKVRNLAINTIHNKIYEGGLVVEASEFFSKVNKSIKPSEYQP